MPATNAHPSKYSNAVWVVCDSYSDQGSVTVADIKISPQKQNTSLLTVRPNQSDAVAKPLEEPPSFW